MTRWDFTALLTPTVVFVAVFEAAGLAPWGFPLACLCAVGAGSAVVLLAPLPPRLRGRK